MDKVEPVTKAAPTSQIVFKPNGAYYFSYKNVIAFKGEHAVTGDFVSIRLKNYWSNTTGKHYGKLGCKLFDEVTPLEFARAIGYEGIPDELTEYA